VLNDKFVTQITN